MYVGDTQTVNLIVRSTGECRRSMMVTGGRVMHDFVTIAAIS